MFDRLIDVLLQFVDLFRFWEVVNQYERGVVLRLGKLQREIGPGLHWLIPFNIDRALTDTVVTRVVGSSGLTLTLADKTTINCNVIARMNIYDVKKALLDVEDVDQAVRDSLYGNVSSLCRQATWDQLLEPEFQEQVLKLCRRQARRYGIEIESVVFGDMSKTRSISLIQG